jgi:hypothetical protein
LSATETLDGPISADLPLMAFAGALHPARRDTLSEAFAPFVRRVPRSGVWGASLRGERLLPILAPSQTGDVSGRTSGGPGRRQGPDKVAVVGL